MGRYVHLIEAAQQKHREMLQLERQREDKARQLHDERIAVLKSVMELLDEAKGDLADRSINLSWRDNFETGASPQVTVTMEGSRMLMTPATGTVSPAKATPARISFDGSGVLRVDLGPQRVPAKTIGDRLPQTVVEETLEALLGDYLPKVPTELR